MPPKARRALGSSDASDERLKNPASNIGVARFMGLEACQLYSPRQCPSFHSCRSWEQSGFEGEGFWMVRRWRSAALAKGKYTSMAIMMEITPQTAALQSPPVTR